MNGAWTAAVATWLATYAFHSTLLLGATWALTRLPSLRSPRAGEILWRTALFGGVLTASLHLAFGAPLWRMGVVGAAPPTAVLPSTTVRAVPAAPDLLTAVHVPRSAGPGPVAVAPAPEESPDPAWLLLLWPVGILVLFARGHGTRRRLAHALRQRRDVASEDLRDVLRRLAADAGLTRSLRLTTAPGVASPVALGILRPEICLPARAVGTLAPRHLEAMLAHEVAHLVRHDPAWLLTCRAMTLTLFFQPLNLLAVARLRDASERIADERAATTAPRRVALAECLTIVAAWILEGPSPQTGVVAMAGSRSRLGERVRALLDPPKGRVTLSRGGLALLALAPLLAVLALAPGLGRAATIPHADRIVVEDGGVPDPLAALDLDLDGLEDQVADLAGRLEVRGRPGLARRLETRLRTLRFRRDDLAEALASQER